MIQSPQDLRLGRSFSFQQVNEAKHNMGGLWMSLGDSDRALT